MYAIGEKEYRLIEEDNLIKDVITRVSSFFNGDIKLMVSVFDVAENRFLFCNDAYFNVLGYRTDELIQGGWPFWYQLVRPNESVEVKNSINLLLKGSDSERFPLERTLSYHIKDVLSEWYLISHKLSPCFFNSHFVVINYLYDITQIERIEYSFGKRNGVLNHNDKDQITVSKREKEVLLLIADGLSSKQIADVLYISNHTAIKHRKNLIEKFHVRNTAQLIKEASKRTLL